LSFPFWAWIKNEERLPMPPELLAYFDRLSQDDLNLLYHLGAQGQLHFSVTDLLVALVDRRWQMAESYLQFAEPLAQTMATETEQRQVISRAYYAMHHAARALILRRQDYEIWEHGRVIEALNQLTGGTRRHPSLEANALDVARHRRNAADYNPRWPRPNCAGRPRLRLRRPTDFCR